MVLLLRQALRPRRQTEPKTRESVILVATQADCGSKYSNGGAVRSRVHVDALEFGLAKLLLVILLVNCPLQSKQQ